MAVFSKVPPQIDQSNLPASLKSTTNYLGYMAEAIEYAAQKQDKYTASQLSSILKSISTIQSNISGIQSSLSTINSQISNLTSRVEALEEA